MDNNNINNNSTSVNPVNNNTGVVNSNSNQLYTSQPTVTNSVPVNSTVASQVNNQTIPSQPVVNQNPSVQPIVSQTAVVQPVNNVATVQKSNKTFYTWMFVIIGLVLIIAIILLVFLLNGGIQNRNRLTCNKTTQESGYEYTVDRYYIFDDKVMQRVNLTYTFKYNTELTEERYNQDFDEVINNEHYGSTKYGFATNIKKEGNVVTITAYQPSYWKESLDKIKDQNKNEGYSCK